MLESKTPSPRCAFTSRVAEGNGVSERIFTELQIRGEYRGMARGNRRERIV